MAFTTYSLDDTPEGAPSERGKLEQALSCELLSLVNSPHNTFDERSALDLGHATPQVQNLFGLELIGRLAVAHPHKNVLISPLSVWSCGVWVQNGAAGATKAGLRRAFAMDGQTSDERWNVKVKHDSDVLRQQSGAEIRLANGLWSEPGCAFDADFERLSERYFGAAPSTLDFQQSEHAAQTINSWIAAQTSGKIPLMVTADNIASASVVLANALYFKALWKNSFDPKRTQLATFTAADGSQESGFMMGAKLKTACVETASFQAVRLPYADTSCALWAVLPAVGIAPLDALKHWNQTDLSDQWEERIDLQLPRFTLDFSDDITKHLGAMGAREAFQAGADFSKLGNAPLWINAFLHKTRLEIDEKGTVAAAATVVTMTKSASRSTALTFNRPFALVLTEEKSRTPVFMGIVNTISQL
ncbi:MAG TPA: serpin family protein [Abditibacterium sp.]|jgi:serpin B